MNIMEKANTIMDYIPRRRGFSEDSKEAFQHFEERDDFSLENRDESYFEAN